MSEKEMFFRDLLIDRKAIQVDDRIVPASLSTETEVPRYYGMEVLRHDKDSVDLARAADGLPLLFGHDQAQPIGLAENVRLDGNRLRADLRFSKNARAEEVWRDVREGFLKNVSIGYRVNEWEEEGPDKRIATNWSIFEASVVSVPADANSGINRADNSEVKTMTEKTETRTSGEDTGQGSGGLDVREMKDQFQAAREKAIEEGKREGMRLEQERRDGIENVFRSFLIQEGVEDLMKVCQDQGLTVDNSRDALLKYLGDGITPTYHPVSDEKRRESITTTQNGMYSPKITMQETDVEKFCRAAEVAISVQANGVYTQEQMQESRKHEYHSMTVTDLAREYLRLRGVKAVGNREQVIGLAFQQRGISHGTSDFSSLLENVAMKSLLAGYEEAPETWNRWCQTKNLPDFKQASLLNLSLFSDLDLIPEMGQYEHGDMSDVKETIQLSTYGKMMGISRQALANDDLDALSATPRRMGRAANRKVGDIAYAILTTGTTATMNQDGVALFAAGHSNYVTSGAAPSVATLQAGELAMSTQTDPSGATITIIPRYLIVPRALRISSEVLIASKTDPTTAGDLKPNPFNGTLEVVADHRLDTANANGWYLAAGEDTVVVGFLNGQQTPYFETKDGWDVDGVQYKVRHDVAAAAADYRGLYYNDGVT